MDGTAFQNEVPEVIDIFFQCLAEPDGGSIVLIPVGIETVVIPAPGVEFPVNASQLFSVSNKGRSHIPGPGIIRRYLQDLSTV